MYFSGAIESVTMTIRTLQFIALLLLKYPKRSTQTVVLYIQNSLESPDNFFLNLCLKHHDVLLWYLEDAGTVWVDTWHVEISWLSCCALQPVNLDPVPNTLPLFYLAHPDICSLNWFLKIIYCLFRLSLLWKLDFQTCCIFSFSAWSVSRFQILQSWKESKLLGPEYVLRLIGGTAGYSWVPKSSF